MKTFDDLDFGPHPIWEGIQAHITFANGYGASVIKNTDSYGGKDGLYELAVMLNDVICYTTYITSNVIGYQSPDQISMLLNNIEDLQAVKEE